MTEGFYKKISRFFATPLLCAVFHTLQDLALRKRLPLAACGERFAASLLSNDPDGSVRSRVILSGNPPVDSTSATPRAFVPCTKVRQAQNDTFGVRAGWSRSFLQSSECENRTRAAKSRGKTVKPPRRRDLQTNFRYLFKGMLLLKSEPLRLAWLGTSP